MQAHKPQKHVFWNRGLKKRLPSKRQAESNLSLVLFFSFQDKRSASNVVGPPLFSAGGSAPAPHFQGDIAGSVIVEGEIGKPEEIDVTFFSALLYNKNPGTLVDVPSLKKIGMKVLTWFYSSFSSGYRKYITYRKGSNIGAGWCWGICQKDFFLLREALLKAGFN